MLFFFRLAIFLGAGLLFLIQPMFAKMVLPVLGGSPAVWNTCMLFFQGMLLAGYAYAHLGRRLLGYRAQIGFHLVLLVAALLAPAMYLSKEWTPPEGGTPIFWLLGVLFVVVGAPFFVVSATSPLLQQWFAATRHERAENPYFLYAASNAGSIIALLAYPFLIERILAVENQGRFWKYTYFAFVVSMIACAILVFRNGKENEVSLKSDDSEKQPAEASELQKVNWRNRLFWIGLAFVPSSWMLGVTAFLTTDISPMPTLWIIPLSIYLLTFIIAFSDKPILASDWMLRLFPVSMLILVATSIFKGGFLVMGFHLVIFFFGAMMCHFELAKRKPKAEHLTEFYFWISLGGLLGGVFNGLIAPLLFPWILEYPLTLMLACALCPTFEPDASVKQSHSMPLTSDQPKSSRKSKGKKQNQKSATHEASRKSSHEPSCRSSSDSGDDLQRKIKLGTFVIFVLAIAIMANTLAFQGTTVLILTTMLGLAAMCIVFFANQPTLFAIPLGVVLIVAKLEPIQPGETVIYTDRGFFGVNRVVDGPLGYQKRLYHGTTVHGIQSTDPNRPDLHRKPMSYYHETGPLGMIFKHAQIEKPFRHVGVVGLGAGTAAYYCRDGQKFTFFEIDPIVKEIAENPKFFTFLQACGKENYEVILGDGRLKLSKEAEGDFDLLVFDAFSSDAIPIHLLTKEAIELYLSKLSPDGLMAFHISNLHFDLEPILGDIAEELDLESLVCHDIIISEEEMKEGKAAASYLVIAKDLRRSGLSQNEKWKKTRTSNRKHVWTDDFSNLFDALK